MFYLRRCLFIFGLLAGFIAHAQTAGVSPAPVKDTGYLIVRNILVQGNKKTRTSILLRELSTVPGDTIYLKDLSQTLEDRRKQLLNTSLFLNVTANIKNWKGKEADLVFEVWERWYIIPFPIFKLADRNFNQWWVAEGHSLNRVNLGLRVTHSNLTGRMDRLVVGAQMGYTQKLTVAYTLPYIDKHYHNGLGINFSLSRNREINDSTSFNKQLFYKSRDFIQHQYTAGLVYSYRKAINTRHQVFLNYYYEDLADSVALLRPNYLGGGRSRVQYLELMYLLTYINADSWKYPLRGVQYQASISRRGIPPIDDIKDWQVRARAARYWQLGAKTFGALGARGQAMLPENQPYINQKALGYNDDFLRGLEYFVIDGTSFFMAQSTFRYEAWNFNLHLPVVPGKFNRIPFRLFLKAYGDMGYVYNKLPGNGMLNNKMLYTAGVGLDIVSFYDTCLRLEYSINQLGQKGLFLHTKIDM
ncbi:Surface antigen [Chitinophaga costaii]|uniref:Surface antigen n=1 Tax=Chitinophaga costaii TaxID=1335309 RepID=A0A1C4F5I8_9BACT|nr:POTRA domain-containing protein [Chitinophaga costaii]PUZ21271.1 hypothetical protein DCM91_17175 [Chitinophaga costaii]SCC51200.1 Surface antigen [Chitinophaga costaii]